MELHHQNHTKSESDAHDLPEVEQIIEIERALEEVASLSKVEKTQGVFEERILSYAIRALSAVGGAIWIRDKNGELHRSQALRFETLKLTEGDSELKHTNLVRSVFETKRSAVLSPHSMTDTVGPASNPTDYALVLQPLMVDDSASAVMELILSPDMRTGQQRAIIEVVASFGELATDFYLRDELRKNRTNTQTLNKFDEFTNRIHSNPKLKQTSLAVVNQGRRFLGCDRVSLVLCGRWSCSLKMVSGAESINRRSNTVRRLEKLAECVLDTGVPQYCFGDDKETPAEIEGALKSYQEECSARHILVIPLVWPTNKNRSTKKHFIGALVLEHFQDELPPSTRQRMTVVGKHSALALRNAVRRRKNRMPSWLRPKRISKIAMLLVLVSLVVASLVVIPAEFTIEARGQLQPLDRHDIFAPTGGIVRTIHAKHSQHVMQNEPLVVLENPDLKLQHEQTRGEMMTARKRLLALEATRGTRSYDKSSHLQYRLLIAEEQELKERLTNLENQMRLIEAQQESLILRSAIDGEVVTWNLQDVLENRPVERGDRLVSVAASQKAWVLELLIPDKGIGHILDAQKQFGDDLKISYILATDPSVTFTSKIDSVSKSTELYEDNQPYVKVTSNIPEDQIFDKRPGATVVAKVHCGQRSIGYVWLRELIEAVQRHVFF